MQLQNMCKKGHESFKEYAQRWRDLAAQVAPPMTEKEMITIIVDTLPVFYYEKKWCGTHVQALRIWSSLTKGSMWVWKEANLIILLGWMRNLRQMERARMKEKPMLWLSFLHGNSPTSSTTSLVSQYQPFSLSTTQSSTKAIPKSTTIPNSPLQLTN